MYAFNSSKVIRISRVLNFTAVDCNCTRYSRLRLIFGTHCRSLYNTAVCDSVGSVTDLHSMWQFVHLYMCDCLT